ncbi:hypothetical protein [Sphingomonas bacterium]|uniref:hypothetical protein n=1 Tax=Sphingomonas bacterium TaxID=1895847 RepID=UPI002607AC68|nr:hypothetical protein [Sphingomonas bacterium]MDB5678251.1 hypothetical protein [Sphingomonas bacterium]
MTSTIRPLDPARILRLSSIAVGAAFASASGLALLWFVGLATGGVGAAIWLAAFIVAHGFFIALVTATGLGPIGKREGAGPSLGIAIKAAVPIALPLAAAFGLVAVTSDLRWSLLGWGMLVALALPARIVCRLRGERPAMRPVGQRVAFAALALALIELPGWPIQSCTGECWGFMEGGIVAVPLLGTYLFFASFSAALLSIHAVRGVTPA